MHVQIQAMGILHRNDGDEEYSAQKSYDVCMMREIHPIISQCSNTTVPNVRRNIRHLIFKRACTTAHRPTPFLLIQTLTTHNAHKYIHIKYLPYTTHSKSKKKKSIFNFLFIPHHFLAFPVEPYRKGGNTVTKLKRPRDHPASRPPSLRILYPIPIPDQPTKPLYMYTSLALRSPDIYTPQSKTQKIKIHQSPIEK